MQLDNPGYAELIDAVLNAFASVFGQDMSLIDKRIAIEHMGWFKITYKYLPLRYDIVFESDRDIFSIYIYDDEGACTNLYRIEKVNNETTPENVHHAARVLRNILEKNDFCFYVSQAGKLYRKQGQQYRRIKDMSKLDGR